MKRFGYLIVSVIILLSSRQLVFTQSTGDYQSYQNGFWSDIATWEIFDGTNWIPATSVPAGSSGENITIKGSDTVTVSSAITISSGCNVIVNGYLKATVSITAPTSAPLSFTFNNGSTYEHAMNAGSIPMSVWNSGSTCLITGITGNSPGNSAQNFYNFIWNCPGQTTGLNVGWDNITIGGNITVIASGPAPYQFRLTSASTPGRTITINGDVVVDGGLLTASGSSGAAQYNVTVKGNIILNGGRFSLCAGSGGYGTWRLWGNLIINSGAQFITPSNTTVNTRLIFAGGGTQNYTNNGGINNNLHYGVENGTTVILNSPLNVGNNTIGGLVLTDGKFVTTSTNIITLSPVAVIYSVYYATWNGSSYVITSAPMSQVGSTPAGYVDGPLAVNVNVSTAKSLDFPLGKNVYRPVTLNITQDATTTTTYTAEIFDQAPPSRTLPYGLDSVNSKWFIRVNKSSGANVTSATIKMSYGPEDDNVENASMIRIAMDDGAGQWINLAGSGTADSLGTILSDVFNSLTINDFVIAHVDSLSLPTLATLTTDSITKISTTFATGGGNITNSGNAAITARGVCWNTTQNPDTSNEKTNEGTGSGPFTSILTGLTPGQTYYVRAYAVNAAGVAYGDEVSFTTLSDFTVPTVTTNPVTNIINKTATGSGTISEWGGSEITDRGVCWSATNPNPTLEDCDEYNGLGAGEIGTFTIPIGVQAYGTLYYVRAYATNSTGTGYGNVINFTSPAAQPDVYKIVDKNGIPGVNCDYTTVQDAFNAVPQNYTGRWMIYVKKGIYYEKTWLTRYKTNVVLIGEDRDSTILTFDDWAGKNTVTNFPEGSIISNGTANSFTCAIDAPDFEAQRITFQNTANAYAPGSSATQAVALRANGDRQKYYNCKMLGYQDTYYTQGGITGPDRIYHKNCYIEGSVDFIFGRDVAVFDSCIIYTNRGGGVITAAATEPGYSYGYVFLNCTLDSPPLGSTETGNGQPMTPFYLGRPWQQSPKTVYISSYEPATVHAAGWTTMSSTPSLYSEYNCYGPGSVSSRPVIWSTTNQPSTLTPEAAATYTLANIFSKNNRGSGYNYPSNWLPSITQIYNLSINAVNGSVSVDPAYPAYVSGAIVHLTAVPSPGYVFTGWSGDITSTDNPIDIIMDNNKIITANFVAVYNLNVTVSGNGSVTKNPDLELYAYGTEVTLTANPATGWNFTGWSGDVISAENPVVITIDGNKNITATFSINKLNLNINILGNGSVVKNPDLTFYDYGTEVSLTAIPAAGWGFAGWTGDVISTDNPLLVITDSNKNITATFNILDTNKYRSFIPEDIVTVDGRGKVLKAVKRKPVGGYWEFTITNNTGSAQNELHIQFKNDVAFDRGLTADPFTSVSNETKKKFNFTGTTIPSGDSVVVKGYSMKGKPQQIKKYYWGADPKQHFAVNINPGFEHLELPMPTYANLIEEIYVDDGFAEDGGLLVGTPHPDAPRDFGWVLIKKSGDVQKSLRDKSGIHTGGPKFFDIFENGKPLVKEQKLLPPTKQNNKLFAELVALRLAIAASASGHTQPGFPELIYHDTVSAYSGFNGMMIKDIYAQISASMTSKNGDPNIYYQIVRKINEAFTGPIDTISFANATVLKGVRTLAEVPFLIPNPDAVVPYITRSDRKYVELPDVFELSQNYPNPFNPVTTIEFTIPEDANVSLKVYNILGQEVATLADKELFTAGTNEVDFDASNLTSGVYFYRINVENIEEPTQRYEQVKKMLLIK